MKTITKLSPLDRDIEKLSLKLNELIDAHNAQVTEEVWPKVGNRYWFFLYNGEVMDSYWDNVDTDRARRDFLGIYRTEAEALEAKEKIIKAVKGI